KDEQSERDLQAEAPGDHAPPNGASVARQRDTKQDNESDADQPGETGDHGMFASSPRVRSRRVRRSGQGRNAAAMPSRIMRSISPRVVPSARWASHRPTVMLVPLISQLSDDRLTARPASM